MVSLSSKVASWASVCAAARATEARSSGVGPFAVSGTTSRNGLNSVASTRSSSPANSGDSGSSPSSPWPSSSNSAKSKLVSASSETATKSAAVSISIPSSAASETSASLSRAATSAASFSSNPGAQHRPRILNDAAEVFKGAGSLALEAASLSPHVPSPSTGSIQSRARAARWSPSWSCRCRAAEYSPHAAARSNRQCFGPA